MKNYFLKHDLDPVSYFRVFNGFIVYFVFSSTLPIVMKLRGEYMATWVISMFMILETLSIKANKHFLKMFNIPQLFKLTIGVNFVFWLAGFLYFYNKTMFVYTDTILSILNVAIISSFSIALNQYQASNTPHIVERYQIASNSIYADTKVAGFVMASLVSY